jgi:putative flippase GtrA
MGRLAFGRKMKERLDRLMSSEMTKFLIVGGVSFVVNALALGLFHEVIFAGVDGSLDTPWGELTLRLFLSSAVAVEIAIIVRFLLNDSWTFRDRREKSFRRRFVQSNVTSLASPLISVACVNLLTPVLGGNYQVANAIGVLLGLAWNWGWSSRVVWRAADDPIEQPEAVRVR